LTAQRFHIDKELVNAAYDLRDDIFSLDSTPNGLWPLSSRLPAPLCLFLVDMDFGPLGAQGQFVFMAITYPDIPDRVSVLVLDEDYKNGKVGDGVAFVGTYTPGTDQISLGDVEERDSTWCFQIVASICCLISDPVLVRTVPAHSRQVRRRLEAVGKNADAKTLAVKWTVLSDRDMVQRYGRTGKGVALHYRRGHFRRAEPHFAGAMQMPHALRAELREGWFQWIDGMWVGHPAFGIRRHDYTPQAPMGKTGP
jgi:hypothetical protein